MPELERIQQNTPGTLSQQWYEDGAAVDPGTVTVGITRADGTTLVAAGTATTGSGSGVRTYNLTTTHTALLDRLTVTWTSTLKGSQVTYVEVVGGFLFSISQARQLAPLNNATTYTTARIVEARTLAEQTIEDACGRAFVPRYTRETLSGSGTTDLMLSQPDLRSVRSVTVTTSGVGTAYTSPELALLAVNPSGLVYGPSSWTAGTGNITVGYEHGSSYPPARVSQAALILARSWLVSGPVDNRALGQASPDGSFSFGLATPGRNGSYVGIPEVDAVIDQYSLRVGVA